MCVISISYTCEIMYGMCAMISYSISYCEIAKTFQMKYINKSYMISYGCDIIYMIVYTYHDNIMCAEYDFTRDFIVQYFKLISHEKYH